MNREKYPSVSTWRPSVFSSMGKDAARRALSALSRAAIITSRIIGRLHNDDVVAVDDEEECIMIY